MHRAMSKQFDAARLGQKTAGLIGCSESAEVQTHYINVNVMPDWYGYNVLPVMLVGM